MQGRNFPRLCAGAFVVAASLLLVGGQAASASHAVVQATTAGPISVDPDTLPKGSADAVTIVRFVSPGHYQLEVQNTSGVGAINTFNWVAPVNLTVTSVTSVEGGKCSLVSGDIQCSGDLAAPTCTCSAGGSLIVNFTASGLAPTFANGYWTYYGIVGSYLQIETMTPVPYHIPSFQSGATEDLPLCKKGQKSTAASPCVAPE